VVTRALNERRACRPLDGKPKPARARQSTLHPVNGRSADRWSRRVRSLRRLVPEMVLRSSLAAGLLAALPTVPRQADNTDGAHDQAGGLWDDRSVGFKSCPRSLALPSVRAEPKSLNPNAFRPIWPSLRTVGRGAPRNHGGARPLTPAPHSAPPLSPHSPRPGISGATHCARAG
jgi:hypothetical protein